MALTIPPYAGQGWTDNSTPDLSAETLNAVDAGITANSNAINAIANAVVSQIVNDPNKIASMAALYAVNSNLIPKNSEKVDGNYTNISLNPNGWTEVILTLNNKLSSISYIQITPHLTIPYRIYAPIVTAYTANTVTMRIYSQESSAATIGLWVLAYGK